MSNLETQIASCYLNAFENSFQQRMRVGGQRSLGFSFMMGFQERYLFPPFLENLQQQQRPCVTGALDKPPLAIGSYLNLNPINQIKSHFNLVIAAVTLKYTAARPR